MGRSRPRCPSSRSTSGRRSARSRSLRCGGCSSVRLAIVLASFLVAATVPAVARALAVPQTGSFCQLSDGTSTSGAFGCAQGDLESVALSLAPQVTLQANFNSAPGFDTLGSVKYDFQVVGGH